MYTDSLILYNQLDSKSFYQKWMGSCLSQLAYNIADLNNPYKIEGNYKVGDNCVEELNELFGFKNPIVRENSGNEITFSKLQTPDEKNLRLHAALRIIREYNGINDVKNMQKRAGYDWEYITRTDDGNIVLETYVVKHPKSRDEFFKQILKCGLVVRDSKVKLKYYVEMFEFVEKFFPTMVSGGLLNTIDSMIDYKETFINYSSYCFELLGIKSITLGMTNLNLPRNKNKITDSISVEEYLSLLEKGK